MALSLYNKYRPQTFVDVVGQQHVEKTLANAVEKNSVSHAYLFCGPRGTGKTTTARILAKALLCDKAPTSAPDGTCEQCVGIADGIHPDVYELDAASRTGVDNVREEIISRVNFAPTKGRSKIYIIDEVHMLSTPAFNALLKTLEEPPAHVVFVLCTTDVHKVPDTVQTRCQRFDFKRLAVTEIVGRLQYICEREGLNYEPAALELIAQRSQGGMRDAIRSLEQVAVFSGGKIAYAEAETLLGMVDSEQLFGLCDDLAHGDAAACFNWVAAYVQSGSDIAILVNDLATHVRNLYAVSIARGEEEHLISALEIDEGALPRLREQAALFSSLERLAWMLTVLGSLSAELKNAANARLALEVALTRMLYPESVVSLEALTVRVADLEKHLAESAAKPQSVYPYSSTSTNAQGQAKKQVQEQEEHVSKPFVKETELQEQKGQAQEAAQEKRALYRNWNSVVDAIKKEKPGVAASLGGATPLLNKEGKKLSLELPAGSTTSLQYLESEANRSLLTKTVMTVFEGCTELDIQVAKDADPKVQERAEKENLQGAETKETTPRQAAMPAQEQEGNTQTREPNKEELENILSSSLNSTIKFEEA